MSSASDLVDAIPTAPLRIERVLAPQPHYGSGTYEVRLELSRPMTCFERQALHGIRRGMLVVNRVLTIYDTTLERVAADADDLAAVIRQAEEDGGRLQQNARRRARQAAAQEARESQRLSALAEQIHFPDIPRTG
jgi:hypothetical protein